MADGMHRSSVKSGMGKERKSRPSQASHISANGRVMLLRFAGAQGSRLQAPGSRLQAPDSRLQTPDSGFQAHDNSMEDPRCLGAGLWGKGSSDIVSTLDILSPEPPMTLQYTEHAPPTVFLTALQVDQHTTAQR